MREPPAKKRVLLRRRLAALRRHDTGATLLEYLVLVGVCALAAIIGFKHFGRQLQLKARHEGDIVATLDAPRSSPATVRGSDGRIFLPVLQPQCFAAGTLVATASGDRPIESIAEGDLVFSRDEHSGSTELKPVLHTFFTPDQEVIDLELGREGLGAEHIVATPGHRFWSEGSGWVRAETLANGALFSPEGALRGHALSSVRTHAIVYNLEVGDFHTYFVGRRHAWVHNADPNGAPGAPGCGREEVTYGATAAVPSTKQRLDEILQPTRARLEAEGKNVGLGISRDATVVLSGKDANGNVHTIIASANREVYKDLANMPLKEGETLLPFVDRPKLDGIHPDVVAARAAKELGLTETRLASVPRTCPDCQEKASDILPGIYLETPRPPDTKP